MKREQLDSASVSAPVNTSTSTPSLALTLTHCRYEVWPSIRTVATTFPDGKCCLGMREDNDSNRREAESQGYTGTFAVWRSLVEHELLHSLIADYLFNRPSLVMRTESGGEFTPSWLRYEEEALAIAFQVLSNTGRVESPLLRYQYTKLRNVWNEKYQPCIKLALLPIYSGIMYREPGD